MPEPFRRIGLFAKYTDPKAIEVLGKVVELLISKGHTLAFETHCYEKLPHPKARPLDREVIAKECDLIIVVGGDGTLLNAARAIVPYQIPIVGINRGRIGFLVDILPDQLEASLSPILNGHYIEEKRFLLEMFIKRQGQIQKTELALNDVVLYAGNTPRLFEFQVFINDEFVSNQRSDGLIVSTPTGSTAYALSAGGPILTPTANAIVLVPMFPHTLSSRPIVVSDTSNIKLVISPHNVFNQRLSCDGQSQADLQPGDTIEIRRHPKELRLIHPEGHNYFGVLRKKLNWNIENEAR